MFAFNGNYKDHEQVAPFLAAFTRTHDEIEASGKYTYNDSFKGRIEALNPATSKDEDTAIYLLQSLLDITREQQCIAALKAEGYREIQSLPARVRFDRVVVYRAGHFVGGTGWIATYDNVRIIPDAEGKPYALLEKGKKTNGRLLGGCQVLACQESAR